MGYADRSYSYSPGRGGFGDGGAGFGGLTGGVTPWVLRLLVANALVFLVMAVGLLPARWAVQHFGFSPGRLLTQPWTPVTYMFLHGGFWHVLVNMIVLFFFGPPLERTWGSTAFIRFYLVAGLGGALFSLLFLPSPAVSAETVVIGASGAIFGLMLAFALRWPDARIYIWGILPMRAKWFVGLLAVFTLYASFAGGGGNVAHWTHLGGLVTGYAYLRYGQRLSRALDRLAAWWADVLPISTAPPEGRSGTRSLERERRLRKADGRSGREDRGDGEPPEQDVLDEVDRILDKIREQGLDSLTREERDFLDEMSRRYRG